MKNLTTRFLLATLCLLFVGCTVRRNPIGGGGDGGGGSDTGRDTLPPVNSCNPGCGPTDFCDNGLDDDCDGVINDGCSCTPGETRPCFNGPPDRRNLGACSDGVLSCGEFGWSECQGAVNPTTEVCDGQDNDCNGATDENLPSCAVRVQCPGRITTRPLSVFNLSGSTIYGGPEITSWEWEFRCPDGIAGTCPAPTDPNARDTSVYISSSGVYQVHVTMGFSDGSEQDCTYAVEASAGGLRVELDWDTMRQGVDLDLHLHQFTSQDSETGFHTDDDCYYANCRAPFGGVETINWGLENSEVDSCNEAPRGVGARWDELGYCRNPRLDVDTNGPAADISIPNPDTNGDGMVDLAELLASFGSIARVACDPNETDPESPDFCGPENINVDNPVVGLPYRIMVNYYSGGPDTYANVNIYCNGQIRATFGGDPPVRLRETGTGAEGTGWYIADVVFTQGQCGLDCEIFPIDDIQPTSGSFGPPWSCVASGDGTCRR